MSDGVGSRGQVVGRAKVIKVTTWLANKWVKEESEGLEYEVDENVIIEVGLENEESISSIFLLK